MPSLSLQNDFLSIHGFCSGQIIFPCSHRVQDPVPTPVWCSHRSNYQITSIFVFLLSIISICLFIRRFCILTPEHTLSLNCRIFVHAKNNFNHFKENFLDFQRRNNASVSPSQAVVCTCPFTGVNQPFCPQLNICLYLQERETKSFIL